MMVRVAVLIDGGNLRVLARKANRLYNPDFIEAIAHRCVASGERPVRFLYYDCAPYVGKHKLPVSNGTKIFTGSDQWLRSLACRDLFAVRKGTLKFRGFKPKKIPIASHPLSDEDFRPDFEQKGVDMRIGLDIAEFSRTRSVDRIIMITGDTDCIPAMKHGRKAGLQVALARCPGAIIAPELLEHADFDRPVSWPSP